MSDTSEDRASDRMAAMAGAFAGVALLFISVLFGVRSSFDRELWLAVYSFIVTVPAAGLAVIMAYKCLDSDWFMWPFWSSGIFVTVGIACTLWHVDWKIGVTFLALVILAALYFGAFTVRHES